MKNFKRIVASLLSVLMVLSCCTALLSIVAFADDFNIRIGSVNSYGWGGDSYPVILVYGEGGTVETKVGGNWFQWWYAAKAEWDETEGAFVVNALDTNGETNYAAWTCNANEIILMAYSSTEIYAADKDAIANLAIGDKLYASGFDFTNPSANNLIVDGVSPINFSNVPFEVEEVETVIVPLSVGKSYTTSAPTRTDAFNDDGVKLTNGSKGNADAGSAAQYSGWNSPDKTQPHVVEVTIDLEEAVESDAYTVYFAGGNWGIGVPTEGVSVEVFASDAADGEFTSIATGAKEDLVLTNGTGEVGSSWSTYELAMTIDAPVTARFIKVVVTHEPIGNAFIWMDEVEVGKITPVSELPAPAITINPTVNFEYAAGATVLVPWTMGSTLESILDKQYEWFNFAVLEWDSAEGVYKVAEVLIGTDDKATSDFGPTAVPEYGFIVGAHSDAFANHNAIAQLKAGDVVYIYGENLISAEQATAIDAIVTTAADADKTAFAPAITSEYKEGLTIEIGSDVKTHRDFADTEAGLADGKWGENADSFANADVYLMQNLVCTDANQSPEINFVYNFGEATEFNTIKLGLYGEYNSMVGYPGSDVVIAISEDGSEWTDVTVADLGVAIAEGDIGTVIAEIALAEAVTANFVKVTVNYPASPFADKVVWEFVGFTEFEISYVAPEAAYKEGLTIEIGDDVKTHRDFAETEKGLADGKWGENADSFANADVYLMQNLVCTDMWQNPEINFIYGYAEETTIDTIKLGLYGEYNSMVGYPANGVFLYSSNDGVEWEYVEYLSLGYEIAEGDKGTVVSTMTLTESATAKYFKVSVYYPESPFADKVVWEFMGFTEVELASLAPEYKDGLNIVIGDDVKTHRDFADTEAGLADGKWGENADSFANADVYLMMNLVCTDANKSPAIDFIYNYGEAAKTNVIKLGLYGEYNSMVGYPGKDIKVSVSSNGIVWEEVAVLDLGYEIAEGDKGTVIATLKLDAPVTAKLIKVTVNYPASPFAEKVVWEFMGFTEVEFGYEAPPAIALVEGENNVTIPAGGVDAYIETDRELVLTIDGNWTVTVVVNGVEYWPNRMGKLEAPLAVGKNEITFNNSDASVDLVVVIAEPVYGITMDNPIIITELGDYTADVTADFVQGVFYKYVSTFDGELTLTIKTESEWTYVINNLTTFKYGDNHWFDDDPVVSFETIQVSVGDEIMFVISTYDGGWTAPIGTVDFNLSDGEDEPVAPEYKDGLNIVINDEVKTHRDFAATEAGLADGKWGEGATGFGDADVYLMMNLVCTDAAKNPAIDFVWKYAEATAIDTIKLGLYGEYNSMVGYPAKDVKIAISEDGINWTEVTVADLGVAIAEGDAGTVIAEMTLAEAVTANFVKVTVNFPASPFADKVVWEFMGFTEVELSKAEAPAPEIVLGDANGNGEVDAQDYALTKRHVLKTYTLEGDAFKAADLDGDGTIEANEYALIKRHCLKTFDLSTYNK